MIKLEHNNYLVTGAAGFIGSHLVEEILKQGKKVIGIDNLVAGKMKNIEEFLDNSNFTFVKADVIFLNEIVNCFREIDIVFHEAASKCTVCRNNPYLDLMVNAHGSFNVFEASRRMGVQKVIHASTGSVNNGRPKSFYGVSKSAGESYLKAFHEYYPNFAFSCLRYFHVIGIRQDDSIFGGVVPIFIKRLYFDKPLLIYGDGYQIRHFTDVKDVVSANFWASNIIRPSCETYDVVSEISITILELAKLLCKIMERREDFVFLPEKKGDINSFKFESERMDTEFNNDIENILERIIDWYLKNKPWREEK